MATQPTNLPVPSESPRDLKFNAGKIDEFVTSLQREYEDRFGNKHYTIEGLRWVAQQAISAFGYITLDSFEDGNSLTVPNQVLRLKATGEYYRWDGAFPKNVPAGSTPDSTGGIGVGKSLSVGDATLRSDLRKIASPITWFGGVSGEDCSDALESALQSGLPFFFPDGEWIITRDIAYPGRVNFWGTPSSTIKSNSLITITDGSGSRVGPLNIMLIGTPYTIKRDASLNNLPSDVVQSFEGYIPNVQDTDIWSGFDLPPGLDTTFS